MARRAGREQEFRRWPKFKAQYLRTFGHMLEDRRALGLPVLEFASTPGQWFEWWLNDKRREKQTGTSSRYGDMQRAAMHSLPGCWTILPGSLA